MKNFMAVGISSLVAFGLGMGTTALAQDLDLQDEDSRIAYSIGVNIGQNLTSQQLLEGIDFDTFVAGMRDQVNGTAQMSIEEMGAALQIFQERMVAAQNEAMANARAGGE